MGADGGAVLAGVAETLPGAGCNGGGEGAGPAGAGVGWCALLGRVAGSIGALMGAGVNGSAGGAVVGGARCTLTVGGVAPGVDCSAKVAWLKPLGACSLWTAGAASISTGKGSIMGGVTPAGAEDSGSIVVSGVNAAVAGKAWTIGVGSATISG